MDLSNPKTGPGRLESYALQQMANLPRGVAAAAHVEAITGDNNMRDMVAKGIQQQAGRTTATRKPPAKPKKFSSPKTLPESAKLPSVDTEFLVQQSHPPSQMEQTKFLSPESVSTDPAVSLPSETNTPAGTPDQPQFSPQPESDWGAGDAYIAELFAEAEVTAERAVHSDENDEFFQAFESYSAAVELYYKIIPFLAPEDGVDVHERIKMYTRRCEVIREAFEDDPEGQDEIDDEIVDTNMASAQMEQQAELNFDASWNSHHEPTAPHPPPASAVQVTTSQPHDHNRPPLPHISKSAKRSEVSRVDHQQVDPYELQRTRFPDYSNQQPLAVIPEAPRGGAGAGLSASTKAHRHSLSRPISRSAVRASTSSVSRERVAEMQERVNVMQECLKNFTVKRKHLGPARALELHLTTLNANTFGDLKKLAPLAPELEQKWATELEVLLSVVQEIKESRPGEGYALRSDIATHLPALERCDRIVRKTMRSFVALSGHVQYVERETAGGSANSGKSRGRWWVKMPVVCKGGLPFDVLGIVEEAEKEMRGVFKICHEIHVDVVKSMLVPSSFVEALPKHARSLIPRELKEGLTTWGMFKVSDYMKDRNLWDKDAAKEITSSLEKVALIWEQKTSNNKSFLSRTFDIRGERFQQAMTAFRRCQNAIRDLRREWYVCNFLVLTFFKFLTFVFVCVSFFRPTMQHTELDMAKIQHNEDIGYAGLEAYSRALESRAYRLLTRIRELLDANGEQSQKGK